MRRYTRIACRRPLNWSKDEWPIERIGRAGKARDDNARRILAGEWLVGGEMLVVSGTGLKF